MNKFKNGDIVECWDGDGTPKKFVYFAFNDHPEAQYPHVVRELYPGGITQGDVYSYTYCRPVRPDLKIDAPVWVRIYDNWEPRHFAGWVDDGRMKYWSTGMTSHTAPTSNAWYAADQYSITPPGSDK